MKNAVRFIKHLFRNTVKFGGCKMCSCTSYHTSENDWQICDCGHSNLWMRITWRQAQATLYPPPPTLVAPMDPGSIVHVQVDAVYAAVQPEQQCNSSIVSGARVHARANAT